MLQIKEIKKSDVKILKNSNIASEPKIDLGFIIVSQEYELLLGRETYDASKENLTALIIETENAAELELALHAFGRFSKFNWNEVSKNNPKKYGFGLLSWSHFDVENVLESFKKNDSTLF